MAVSLSAAKDMKNIYAKYGDGLVQDLHLFPLKSIDVFYHTNIHFSIEIKQKLLVFNEQFSLFISFLVLQTLP